MGEKGKDASQKSEQATAGQLVPWQRSCGREVRHLVRTRVVTWCPFPTWTSQLLSPLLPRTLHFPLAGVLEFRSSPRAPSASSSARRTPQHPPPVCRRGPRGSPGGGGRPCPPPRAAGAPGAAGWGRRPWRGAQDWAIAATCGTARGDGSLPGCGGGVRCGAAPPARGRDRAGSPPSSARVSGGRGPDGPPMSRAKRCPTLRSPQAPLGFRNRRSGATSSERPAVCAPGQLAATSGARLPPPHPDLLQAPPQLWKATPPKSVVPKEN